MRDQAKEFIRDEDGAVTVDWVVLTAAIVGLGIATYAVVSGGISDTSTDISSFMQEDHITTSFGGDAGIVGGAFSLDGGYVTLQFADVAALAAAVTHYEGLDDAVITAEYLSQYNGAVNGPNFNTSMDYLAAANAELARRGLDAPATDLSFEEVYALRGGDPSIL